MTAQPEDVVRTRAQELSDTVRDIMNLWKQYPFSDEWHITPQIEGCKCTLRVHEDGENLTLALLKRCPYHGVLVDAISEQWGDQ